MNNFSNDRKFRVGIIALSLMQSMMSLLFYSYSGLYYFNEERLSATLVKSLSSQGGDEDFSITWGVALFLFLGIYNFFRRKIKISTIDTCLVFSVLLIQLGLLFLVDVGSFELSIKENNGWILLGWFIIYGVWWLLFFGIFTERFIKRDK